jgi:CubicO group peptidase (beta-lactamase class C family)
MRALPVLAGCLAAALAGPSQAESLPTPAPLTGPDVAAWLEGFLPYALQSSDVAGAVVVVVKDGEVLIQKGYGYADVAQQTPVDAERTLFRIGSVAKLFTWTAVMQLVESGRLDLDRDVNEYLDFTIPPRDGKPITLRNLMTHTPGFEEVLKNLITDDPGRLPPLDEYLKTWTPERIYPPGEVPAYSNYGATLAGYIVQRVSGEPYDDYIDRHVFEPLGMANTTTRQPLPARFAPRMSKGYMLGSGSAEPYELVGPSPAGAAAATGADMARFMIAYLQEGQLGSAAKVYRLLRFANIAIIAVLAGWAGIVSLLSTNLFAFSPGLDPWILILRLATLVVLVGAAAIAIWNARCAWSERRGWDSRLWSVMLVFSCGVLLWVAIAFNLISFRVDY